MGDAWKEDSPRPRSFFPGEVICQGKENKKVVRQWDQEVLVKGEKAQRWETIKSTLSSTEKVRGVGWQGWGRWQRLDH
jgi:hypothetical protein